MGKQLPGLREYHVSVVEQDDADLPYHAVTELYLDDEDAFQGGVRARGGPGGGRLRSPSCPPGACGCSRE
jgi:hypothetical protein